VYGAIFAAEPGIAQRKSKFLAVIRNAVPPLEQLLCRRCFLTGYSGSPTNPSAPLSPLLRFFRFSIR